MDGIEHQCWQCRLPANVANAQWYSNGCTGGCQNVSVQRLLVHQQGTCSYYCECLVLYAIHMNSIEHKHWEHWARPLAAPAVAKLSQFGDRWCTRTAGPAVVTAVNGDGTHHSVVGAITMTAFFRLAPASNRGLILS
ncbi:hypothetical protein K439DRAFT_1618720 [Ramaria rubella]|nr:hypothetical protein K439DRAFT_1618720 [Ramaria rubella]